MNNNEIILRNGYISLPFFNEQSSSIKFSVELATIINNFSYYGYVLSQDILEQLSSYSKDELSTFWNNNEKEIKKITGANRKMEKFVVYKNFPKEVLNKSEAEYWFAQILMYWDFLIIYLLKK